MSRWYEDINSFLANKDTDAVFIGISTKTRSGY